MNTDIQLGWENYRQLYREIFPTHLSEPEDTPSAPPPRQHELAWQSQWFNGEFGRLFTTTDGQPAEIMSFGWWNRGAGPDFLDATVRLGDRELRGAIEIDTEARDWERHGHATNAHYDHVVLHVLLTPPSPHEKTFTRTSTHRLVPQVILAAEERQLRPAAARGGRCAYPLSQMPLSDLTALIHAAARERAARKGQRLHTIAQLHGLDQMLFQELAAALGYSQNKLAMTVLAQRLPLRFLQAHAAGAEALLLGSAGFLEAKIYESAADDTRAYLRQLWDTWWKHRHDLSHLPHIPWTMTGTRPANHPQRRLAALSHLVTQWRAFRSAFDDSFTTLKKFLTHLEHSYWSHHYTLTSARTARPQAILGTTRILDIIGNLCLPWHLLTHPDLWNQYVKLPAPLTNEKVNRAAVRLLGQRPDAPKLIKTYALQQGLIQLYEDFCLQDHTDCAQCLFPQRLREWSSDPHLQS
jgi:hypothetical protein